MALGAMTYVKGSIAAAAVVDVIPVAGVKLQVVSFRTSTANTFGNSGDANVRLYQNNGTTKAFISDGLTVTYKGEIGIISDYFSIHNNGATVSYYYIALQEIM